ncbi:ABC-2 type transport system ATP-binding protein [Actinacidiphila alni]|uniref:ABC-2 type transport system ATP-binding protein n=1 Tax=Actinacidiphila alni TaxID=380248 RepID=A0A1I2IWH3_9ACTN|nr:ATP-binding cassette domain-containing protein [Actinacidiphila alni]SFF44861.1 ABC-2 type transport system ATP-binding protein [Actinacidiphila alni]
MIKVSGLSKDYGRRPVVDHLDFTAPSGRITGFLGANGAGKSTTLHMIVGLIRPSSGTAHIDGMAYHELLVPPRAVGVLLDQPSVHPRMTAGQHLNVLAVRSGVPRHRVREVLETVGLADAGNKPVSRFSFGMHRRLGLACALLGDPGTLILDEPANGLDPQGIVWLRDLLAKLAEQGRTVLLSSHLLGEVQALAHRVVVLDRGRLVAEDDVPALLDRASARRPVRVASPAIQDLAGELRRLGATVAVTDGRHAVVNGLTAAQIGDAAAVAGIAVHELYAERPDLEAVFMTLTEGAEAPAGRTPPSSVGSL